MPEAEENASTSGASGAFSVEYDLIMNAIYIEVERIDGGNK